MDARTINKENTDLKVLTSTKEERTEFYTLNPWKMTPNAFLIRVARFLYPKSQDILTQVQKYETIPKGPSNETTFKNFKLLESHLMSRVKVACANPELPPNTKDKDKDNDND